MIPESEYNERMTIEALIMEMELDLIREGFDTRSARQRSGPRKILGHVIDDKYMLTVEEQVKASSVMIGVIAC